MSSTPLQAAGYAAPVYADLGATMGGGTPLIVAISKTGKTDEYHVLVKLQLLQSYDRAIFELQQQLAHYRALLDVLLPKPTPADELRLEGTPLNAASVRLLNTIAHMKVSGSTLRGIDETDEDED
jgi:hypothetical protein